MCRACTLLICCAVCVFSHCLALCDPMDSGPGGSSAYGTFPGKNTGDGCRFLLWGIFPTQGLNPCFLCLLDWLVNSLPLAPHGLRPSSWGASLVPLVSPPAVFADRENTDIFCMLSFNSIKGFKGIVTGVRSNQGLCTKVVLSFPDCSSLESTSLPFPELTIEICPLELREGHEGWLEKLPKPRSPYSILLNFKSSLELWMLKWQWHQSTTYRKDRKHQLTYQINW